jgi:hypothetical protein
MPSRRPDELTSGTASPTDWLMFTPTGGPTYKCTVASIAGGVTSVNGYTGAVTISAGTGIGVSGSSGTVTVSNSGVTSLNSLTGGLNIVAGSNITVTPSGSNITIDASGGSYAPTLNDQTGTSYTLALTDANNRVSLSNTSPITVTIPLNTSVNFPIGTGIDLIQTNSGQVTVVGASGVTLASAVGPKIRATFAGCSIIKTGPNTWVMVGDITS